MTEATKVFVQFGTAKFKAVGSEAIVRDQYDAFMGAIATLPPELFAENGRSKKPSATRATVTVPPEEGLPEGYHEQWNGDADPVDADEDVHRTNGAEIDSELLSRAFRADDKSVSLRVLPQGDKPNENALLLLIWGYQRLKGANEVGAVELTESARASGLNLDRIDRTIARMHLHVRRGGRRRGTRYQLNNQGMARAEELLKRMFG